MGAVPEVGETRSQGTFAVAVQLTVPPPLPDIETCCCAGVAPPVVWANVSAWGETVSVGAGGGAVTVRVILIDTGLFDAPTAAICTSPPYGPAARPAGFTATTNPDDAVPEAGDTVNHVAFVVAVQVSAPPPPLLIWIDWPDGTDPPIV